jgi:hypothetical protein
MDVAGGVFVSTDTGLAARLMLGAMVAAFPLAAAAKLAAAPPPPPELGGLVARDIPGVSATPDRTWTATLAVLRANGVPVPAGATWGYLPYDTQFGGVAIARENRVLIDPFSAAGDGRDLALVMAHEAAHLASHATQTRALGAGDPLEEAAAETVSRDLYPAIRHRLRLDQVQLRGSYQQQVSWLRRATTRGCAFTMGGSRAHVERCARHTRRWFLTASDTERTQFATTWATGRVSGVQWVNPWPARTIAQQLIVERRRWAAERARYRRTIRALAYRPDAHVAFQLAALAYGQDWRHLRACALSEGYREAERYDRTNARPNRGGSGATGPFQFMAGTFAGTPQGRAGLDWHRVDVQAHAAAWMWSVGRIGEWSGKGC